MKNERKDEMPVEVDFANGLRGKYVGQTSRDAVYVPLETDVSETFRSPAEVNSALRMLMKIAAAAKPHVERKTN